MADGPKFSDFTRGEQATITALIARMALPRADIGKIKRRIEHIETQAAKRKNS
ncbi:DUF6257 family protein [Streptomyces sp. cmx-10-25]|uniref:DUF6257 family protein n=1 Tax=Streptomyces sp. cmx-10-25 TaxID=2790919 RepID=UPI00397F6655